MWPRRGSQRGTVFSEVKEWGRFRDSVATRPDGNGNDPDGRREWPGGERGNVIEKRILLLKMFDIMDNPVIETA